jgi:predicted PolB exonuclease-like 3'-5' exonuclease
MKKMENILFLDIETVPHQDSYKALDARWKSLWNHKASFLARNNETPEELYPRAGIYAEFGKIVCISVGYLVKKGRDLNLRVKSFAGDNEKELLEEFVHLLKTNFNSMNHYLCAHNGKEFDYPYLCRRILINELKLPRILDLAGKKPWDVRHIDTMQLWKFGDYKAYTSLDLMAALFNLPSPKDGVDGSMIYELYYKSNDLDRIKEYCQKDVSTLVSIYLRMNNLPALTEEQVTEV